MALGSKERMVDGAKSVAQRAARDGVPVIWDEYELMPHNWPVILRDHPHSINCYQSWADACSHFVDSLPVITKGIFTEYDSLATRDVDVENLTSLTTKEVDRLMWEKQKSIQPFIGRQDLKFPL